MTISDGEPFEWSHIRLGDRYSLAKGGKVVLTDTIESVSVRSASPAIYPQLSLWQRLRRRVTPARWRKPLKPIREARPVEVTIGGDPNPLERHQANLKAMQAAVDSLTR